MTRFDLEQQIMHCWSVCEDLETVAEGITEHGMTKDQIVNVLMGMQQLYQLKFERLFATFERHCRELATEKAQVKESSIAF